MSIIVLPTGTRASTCCCHNCLAYMLAAQYNLIAFPALYNPDEPFPPQPVPYLHKRFFLGKTCTAKFISYDNGVVNYNGEMSIDPLTNDVTISEDGSSTNPNGLPGMYQGYGAIGPALQGAEFGPQPSAGIIFTETYTEDNYFAEWKNPLLNSTWPGKYGMIQFGRGNEMTHVRLQSIIDDLLGRVSWDEAKAFLKTQPKGSQCRLDIAWKTQHGINPSIPIQSLPGFASHNFHNFFTDFWPADVYPYPNGSGPIGLMNPWSEQFGTASITKRSNILNDPVAWSQFGLGRADNNVGEYWDAVNMAKSKVLLVRKGDYCKATTDYHYIGTPVSINTTYSDMTISGPTEFTPPPVTWASDFEWHAFFVNFSRGKCPV